MNIDAYLEYDSLKELYKFLNQTVESKEYVLGEYTFSASSKK